ncbi:hypothetical protein P7C71_g1699, partial [Lecanoromycetidae sp. Uapishka_2]
MEHSSLPLHTANVGNKVFTIHDIIAWKREEAEHRGEIGFGVNYRDMSEIAQLFNFDLDGNDQWPYGVDDHASLAQYADEQHDHKLFVFHQERERQRLMDDMQPLKTKDCRNLRQKVAELTELENPKPKPNYVEVWVSVGPADGLDQMIQLNLPLVSTIAEINQMLREGIHDELLLNNPTASPSMPVAEERGPWKYQLLSSDLTKVIQKSSVLLQTDNDYNTMIKKVNEGSQAPIPVLTREKTAKPGATAGDVDQVKTTEVGDKDITMGEGAGKASESGSIKQDGLVWDNDEVYDEPLDMDGNPYFDPPGPIDWDKVGKKLEKHGGEWPSEIDEEKKILTHKMHARDWGYEYNGEEEL